MRYQVKLREIREYVMEVDVDEDLANALSDGTKSPMNLVVAWHDANPDCDIDDCLSNIQDEVTDWDHLSDAEWDRLHS